MFVRLSGLARATLGYKSLQNDFFYLGKETIDTYGIEKQYLKPLFMLKDFDAGSYLQAPEPRLWLFHCQDKERDLRGTGAYRYILTMADRAATQRKQTQTGAAQTIRQALELQGGQLWYAPKAIPHRHRLWVRKAFDGVYAPFVFKEPTLVDQRCNALSPLLDGAPWDSFAAAITSTLFAYSLEINGSASMGAGALEAPTTRLRAYPVFDVGQLCATEHEKLKLLAEAVWKFEKPVDWTNAQNPGKHLRELDKWLLAKAGDPITPETLYKDLRDVCEARILVANDKTKTTKTHKNDSISSVANSISWTIGRLLESRRFPEDFCPAGKSSEAVAINLDRESLRNIEIHQFMHTAELRLMGESAEPLFSATLDLPVAEAIVRALLAGRGSFVVSNDPKVTEDGVSAYLKWFAKIEKKLEDGIANSALGTGYEQQLTTEVYKLLGLHPLVAYKTLPQTITISR